MPHKRTIRKTGETVIGTALINAIPETGVTGSDLSILRATKTAGRVALLANLGHGLIEKPRRKRRK